MVEEKNYIEANCTEKEDEFGENDADESFLCSVTRPIRRGALSKVRGCEGGRGGSECQSKAQRACSQSVGCEPR